MSVLPFRKRSESTEVTTRAIDAFESETAEVLAREKPRFERGLLYIIIAMVVSFIFLAAVLKLDRVATAPGQIVPAHGTIVVQPLETAIIKSIEVKTGDVVKKGQILATLDPTFAMADFSQLQEKVSSLVAEVAREQAEYGGQPFAPSSTDPYQLLQKNIWEQRQSEYKASLTDFDEKQKSAEASISGLQQDMKIISSRLGVAGDIEQMRADLERRDVGSKLNSMLARDTRLQDEQSLVSDQNNLVATQHSLESVKAEREVFIQQWQSQLGNDLVQNKNELVSAQQYFGEAKQLKDLVELRAPQDAIVLDIAQLSAGSVAQAANAMFTLVPLDAPLVAEVQVSNLDVGFVRVGDQVSLKFDPFPYMRHGSGHGVVKSISEDAFTTMPDGSSVPPYFKARVTLTDTHLKNVPSTFRVMPGMTLQADVLVGKRSILSYLTESTLRTGVEGMREP